MNNLPKASNAKDPIQLVLLLAMSLVIAYLFFNNPSLATPTLLALFSTLLFSPLVKTLERKGLSRILAITLLFATLGIALFLIIFATLQSVEIEWDSLRTKVPDYFNATVNKLHSLESRMKRNYPILKSLNVVDTLVTWLSNSAKGFANYSTTLVGELITWLLLSPLLTFFLLKDGPAIRRRLYQLVPNRYFESFYRVTTQITDSIADYLRAKLIEAFLVGILTTFGLWAVGAPYAAVLGIIAGVTNIVPYVGPLIGAIPGLLIVVLDPTILAGPVLSPPSSQLLWPVFLVYMIVNLVDNILIFPIVVAKLVDLHPLALIIAVIIGQQYYGIIGMLISIPIATAIKVTFTITFDAAHRSQSRRVALRRT